MQLPGPGDDPRPLPPGVDLVVASPGERALHAALAPGAPERARHRVDGLDDGPVPAPGEHASVLAGVLEIRDEFRLVEVVEKLLCTHLAVGSLRRRVRRARPRRAPRARTDRCFIAK